ncbi:hypothetical protein FKP32DRAFT_1671135 [Trametes sanguinea]|nr:hypothetical protein FKP32DRAFT_1671135 [Trametes sanguinea]
MAKLLDVPSDVLADIWDHFARDVHTLRACALTCSALLPVSQYHLFAVVDLRALTSDEFVRKFSGCVTHLCFTPASISLRRLLQPGGDSQALLSTTLALPRLRALSFASVGPFTRAHDNALTHQMYEHAARFVALTALSLDGTRHRDVPELIAFIRAFPALAHLDLGPITLATPERPPSFWADEDRPRLTSFRAAPGSFSHSTVVLLAWLSHTPTAHTLRKLEISPGASQLAALLNTFGPSVQDLVLPIDHLVARVPPHYLDLIEVDCTVNHPDVPDDAALTLLSNTLRNTFTPLPRLRFILQLGASRSDATSRATVDARFRARLHTIDVAGKLEILFTM